MVDYDRPTELSRALWKLGQREQALVICRSVLRAAPLLLEKPKAQLLPARRQLFLAYFRCCAISLAYCRDARPFSDAGYAARALSEAQAGFGDGIAGRVCDAAHSMISYLTEPSRNIALDALMDSCVAAQDYSRLMGRIETTSAAGADIECVAQGIGAILSTPLWDKQPKWNSTLWRVAAFQLISTDENWDPWINWYSSLLGDRRELVTIPDALAITKLPEADWSSPKVVNSKLLATIRAMSVTEAADALDDSSDGDGQQISVVGNQLRFATLVAADDVAVAMRPSMSAEYAHLRNRLHTLKVLIGQWIGKDSHPDWLGLKKDVARLSTLLPADVTSAVVNIGLVWAAGVPVAEYLDQDRLLRADPNSGNAPGLPLNIRTALGSFVQIFAAWVLEFPTASRRETNAGSYTNVLDRLTASKRVLEHVRRTRTLHQDDLRLLEQIVHSADRNGPQAAKAAFWSFATVKKILFAGARVLATSVTGKAIGDYADNSELIKRLTKVFLQGEDAVLDFVAHLPTTSREALVAIIERIRESQ